MQENCRWRATLSLISLLALTISPTFADDDASSASAHILQAERALQRDEYLTAARQYRMAAEISSSVEIANKATKLAFAYEFNDEALISAKRWVKLDDASEEARAYLGQVYFRLDDLRNARKQFERLIEAGPEEPGERLLSLVSYLSEEESPTRTNRLVETLAKPYKDSALAHYAVAITSLQAGQTMQARERAARAVELEPDFLKPQLLYARALMVDGEEDAAIEYLAHIIGDSLQPDPDARMELALIYMMSGRDDDALSQVNQVLLEQSGRPDALRLMAIINFRLERLDAAWDDFQDLLATGEYRMDALYYLGRIADFREQFERAVRLYREVRFGQSTLWSQRRAAALLAHEMNDVDGALALLDDFAETSPRYSVAMVVAKAQLLVSVDRIDEGLALYEQAAEYRPDDPGMVLGRAELLLRTGRLEDAIAEYRVAVKRWPNNALTLNALGYTLADRTDEFKEAEKLIRKAIKMDPENPAIIDSMGWVLFKLGDYEEALVELQRAYARFEDHEVAAHVVEVLFTLERKDEALKLLREAELKTPDSELLADVRARLFAE